MHLITNSITTPIVCIITVTYNAEEFIREFLESLAPILINTPNLKLSLVDNASTDGTIKKVLSLAKKIGISDKVLISALDKNIGFGQGCNAGVEAIKKYNPDLLWILNPDTTVDIKAYCALVDSFGEIKTADFIGSTLKNTRNIKRSAAFRFPRATTTFLSLSEISFFSRLFPSCKGTISLADSPQRAEWLSGASFMVKYQAFETLQGFDPNYFLYFEEVDLFFRAKKAGFEAWSSPNSIIFHISGASTGVNIKTKQTKEPRRPAYWFQSRRYFYIKNYGKIYFLLVDTLSLTALTLKHIKNFFKRQPNKGPENFAKDILLNSLLVKK